MRRFLESELVERLLFTAMVMGILLAAVGVVRYFDISRQLSTNIAAQIHESGGEVTVESNSEAQGLMASDIARRRMVADQSNMMVVGGVGLALLGLGWLGTDILRGRRRQTESTVKESSAPS